MLYSVEIYTSHKNEYFEIHGNPLFMGVSVDFLFVEALTLIHFSQIAGIFEYFSTT